MSSLQEEYQAFEQQERPDGPAQHFGLAHVNIYDGVLRKGQPVQPYDSGDVQPGDRKVKVSHIGVEPLTRGGGFAEFSIDRRLVPFDAGWLKIVKPSLAKLNVSLPMINGAWVHIQMTPDGRKYTNRNGEERQSSTIEFVEIFPDEAACREAARRFFETLGSGQPTAEPPVAQYAPNGQPGNTNEMAVAARFLPVLAKQANGDPAIMAAMIANNPVVGKYFTINSTEVIAALTAAMPAPVPFA